jgi:uncharacterized alkaline shock family protein YloU
VEAARVQDTSLGRIFISSHAIAQIVERTASECYGVVGLGSGRRARRLFPLARPRAVEMEQGSDGIALALRIVVAYGLNLAEVAASVHSRVSYEVQRLTGLPVSSLEVRIDDLRAPK